MTAKNEGNVLRTLSYAIGVRSAKKNGAGNLTARAGSF
jgi:hypothetical protein